MHPYTYWIANVIIRPWRRKIRAYSTIFHPSGEGLICCLTDWGWESPVENGRLLDRYRIWTDTGCIVSATVVSAEITCITAGSSTVDGSYYTRWSKRAFERPIIRPPRTHACVLFYGPWYWRGLEGREVEGDCVPERLVSGYKDGAVLVLATITPHSLHQQEVITTVSCQSL